MPDSGLPVPRDLICAGECMMFGPVQPHGPGSCRKTCRLLRGEPQVPDDRPPVGDKLFGLTAAAMALTDDREGMVLVEAARAASRMGQDKAAQTFRHALMEHALEKLDAGAFDAPTAEESSP